MVQMGTESMATVSMVTNQYKKRIQEFCNSPKILDTDSNLIPSLFFLILIYLKGLKYIWQTLISLTDTSWLPWKQIFKTKYHRILPYNHHYPVNIQKVTQASITCNTPK